MNTSSLVFRGLFLTTTSIFAHTVAATPEPAVKVISRDSIYSIDDRVTSPNNQVHFPFMFESSNGNWYMTLREGPHHWGPEGKGLPRDDSERALYTSDRVQTVYSPDQGETWRPWAGLKAHDTWMRLFRTRLSDGSMISPSYHFGDSTTDAGGEPVRKLVFRVSRDDGATWEEQPREVRGLPYAQPNEALITPCTWGAIEQLDNNRLVLAVYGRTQESVDSGMDRGYSVGLLASNDGGGTWHFESWIAYDYNIGSEGPNEIDLVSLGDGRLLAIFRTGTTDSDSRAGREEPSSLNISRSNDGGRSWSAPEATKFVGGVSPQLLRLESGLLVLSYGSRLDVGDSVRVHTSADDGQTWSAPLKLHDGSSTSYTDLTALDDHRFQIVFDESRFRRSEPEMERNQIVRVILEEIK